MYPVLLTTQKKSTVVGWVDKPSTPPMPGLR